MFYNYFVFCVVKTKGFLGMIWECTEECIKKCTILGYNDWLLDISLMEWCIEKSFQATLGSFSDKSGNYSKGARLDVVYPHFLCVM